MRKNNSVPPFKQFLLAEIFKVLNKHPNKTFNYRQLSKIIKPAVLEYIRNTHGQSVHVEELNSELRAEVRTLLETLKTRGDLVESEPGKYKLKPQHVYQEGIIDITSSGAAYLLSENEEDDIYIAPRNLKNALHGDRVKIYLYAKRKNQRLEGSVVEVLERAKTEFAGTIQLSGRYAFVVPDSPKMLVDIFIPQHLIGGAQNGQKVIASIVDWPRDARNPVGKISTLLGWPGENDVEMNSILSEFGFPLEFPKRVEEESSRINSAVSGKDITGRRDFREAATFTIDPEDAKDFDDALSVRNLGMGKWEIGVHIADVTHYVKPSTQLDKEAYLRGTSVYLVDRVIPMLPEKLSNNLCSLRPEEEKLCFSAVFVLDEEARVLETWLGKTIILSDRRFTYDEAQNIIETGKGEFAAEVMLLHCLAQKLRSERFKQGAIAFEKTEVRFKLSESGKPLGVYLKQNKESNKLIEEFMLLANKAVAEFVGKNKETRGGKRKKNLSDDLANGSGVSRPFVYRVHDGPVNERLQNFATFALRWGYKLKVDSEKDIAHSLNELMKDLAGKKEQNVLEQLAIRTMSKAVYATENIGHYGLGFDFYTHFTSPIRRYPDMLVHRLLESYLNGEKGADQDLLEEQCKHSTQMEIRASDAERASVKYKQVEFLKDQLGQEFDGIISGVTEWGLYVELTENKCEGMIRLRELDDDFYEFDDINYCVTGTRSRRKYTLGDTVRVRVIRCDLLRKQIDFHMVTEGNSHRPLQSSATDANPSKKSSGKYRNRPPQQKKNKRF